VADDDPPWQIALIVDDPAAIKVAAAYYALPLSKRRDIERLADVSGVTQDVRVILTRLEHAGMLQAKPPAVLLMLIREWVLKNLNKR
jgi:hypothetical protein